MQILIAQVLLHNRKISSKIDTMGVLEMRALTKY